MSNRSDASAQAEQMDAAFAGITTTRERDGDILVMWRSHAFRVGKKMFSYHARDWTGRAAPRRWRVEELCSVVVIPVDELDRADLGLKLKDARQATLLRQEGRAVLDALARLLNSILAGGWTRRTRFLVRYTW